MKAKNTIQAFLSLRKEVLRLFCFAALLALQPPLHAGEIGVSEKMGDKIPLDAEFLDSEGERLVLGDYIDRPTLLLLGFYHCARACGLQTASLAEAINQIDDVPGKDFKVLSVSFDEAETPEHAKTMKKNYLNLVRREGIEDHWRFLTGDKNNIERVTKATGYHFQKNKHHDFSHPNVLIAIAKEGKITRYLYGLDVKPFDIGMAIAEAKRGLLGISVKKALSYCFDYDPEKKRYVFRLFRVVAFVTIVALISFYFLFLRKKNR